MPTDKNPAAVALGRKGGAARALALTPLQRSESALKAARARWGPPRKKRKRKLKRKPG